MTRNSFLRIDLIKFHFLRDIFHFVLVARHERVEANGGAFLQCIIHELVERAIGKLRGTLVYPSFTGARESRRVAHPALDLDTIRRRECTILRIQTRYSHCGATLSLSREREREREFPSHEL